MNAPDDDELRAATTRERVALARILARLATSTTEGREVAGFVAAALQQLALVLDRDRRQSEAELLRACAERLQSAAL